MGPFDCSRCTGWTSLTELSDNPDSVCLLIRMPLSTSPRLRNQKHREGTSSFQHSSSASRSCLCERIKDAVMWFGPKSKLERHCGLAQCHSAGELKPFRRARSWRKWWFGADSQLCCASSLLLCSVSPYSSLMLNVLNFWPTFFSLCGFRLCNCGQHHRHSGDRRDFDMQIWHPAQREAPCVLGPGGHPQQRLR